MRFWLLFSFCSKHNFVQHANTLNGNELFFFLIPKSYDQFNVFNRRLFQTLGDGKNMNQFSHLLENDLLHDLLPMLPPKEFVQLKSKLETHESGFTKEQFIACWTSVQKDNKLSEHTTRLIGDLFYQIDVDGSGTVC